MTLDKVKEMIASQLNLKVEDVKEDSKVIDDLGADSLDMIEMLMALEEEFDLEIPDEEAEKISLVGDVVDYIKAHQ